MVMTENIYVRSEHKHVANNQHWTTQSQNWKCTFDFTGILINFTQLWAEARNRIKSKNQNQIKYLFLLQVYFDLINSTIVTC